MVSDRFLVLQQANRGPVGPVPATTGFAVFLESFDQVCSRITHVVVIPTLGLQPPHLRFEDEVRGSNHRT